MVLLWLVFNNVVLLKIDSFDVTYMFSSFGLVFGDFLNKNLRVCIVNKTLCTCNSVMLVTNFTKLSVENHYMYLYKEMQLDYLQKFRKTRNRYR